jgi:hypothetical protein
MCVERDKVRFCVEKKRKCDEGRIKDEIKNMNW